MNETPMKSHAKNTQYETDVRATVESVIEQVEHMTCSMSMNESRSFAANVSRISEVSKHDGQTNYFKPDSERSKHRSGNRRNRVRYRKHKYKPYKPFYKLTATERRRVEERNSRRAYRSREKMSASGLALAPDNTTQFLIADQNFRLADSDMLSPERRMKEDYNSSEDVYSSPDDEQEFIQQQFSETYDSIHDEYINEMSKSDLVRELIRIEDLIEKLEQSEVDVDAEMEKIEVFRIEIQNLLQENLVLERNNEELQKKLSKITAELKVKLINYPA